MGDLLGSPRVVPLFFFRRADPHSLNDAIPSRTPKGEPQWPHPRQAPTVPARCDHTNTNAPDPIKTLQLSVLGTPKGEPQWLHPRQAPTVPARLRG
ncbi:uncharacterized protein DS421_6g186850 [Arachis hypogaea]|nr:uncharacterized protein DS421_6g186850 [Arachis hypogaea]